MYLFQFSKLVGQCQLVKATIRKPLLNDQNREINQNNCLGNKQLQQIFLRHVYQKKMGRMMQDHLT